jgi:ABC-2 type transport system ATP-binding protein
VLEVRGLTKTFGRMVALDGVNLEIQRGEICALLGQNGAGKTTLTSIVAGLRRPDSGNVLVGGIDVVAKPKEASRLIGLVPQEVGVYPTLTVREGMRFFGELADLRGRTLSARIEEVAEALDLTDLLGRTAGRLSGGEKRRVHTAMALVHRPALLLLDEPTAGVDVQTRIRLLNAVRALATDFDTAVCYTTHYLAEVETLRASVAILDDGHYH